MVGNSVSTWRSRFFTCVLSRLSRANTPNASPRTQKTTAEPTPPTPPSARTRLIAAAAAKPTSPQTTCSMRNSCTVRSSPARSSRRRTEALPPSTRSTRSAAERSDGPKIPAAADVGDDDSGRRPGAWSRSGTSRT